MSLINSNPRALVCQPPSWDHWAAQCQQLGVGILEFPHPHLPVPHPWSLCWGLESPTPILTPHIPLPPGFYPAGFCRGGVWVHVNTCAVPDQ